MKAAPYRPPPPPRPGLETGPALCEAEERLRRGRVSVRGEHLVCLESEMHEVLRLLQNATEALRHSRVKPEAIPRLDPEAVNILRFFSGYARRAESELAHYGVKTADGSPHELG